MEETPFSKEKILTHYKEIKRILKGDFPYPRTVHFFISERCNHSCTGCHSINLHKEEQPFLEFNTFKKLIDDFKSKGVEGIEISGGGEPLIHPEISKVIKYANNSGLKVGLFTNATMFNNDNSKDILQNCFFVRIAFDASTEDEYNKIHGKNDYKKIIANIQKLVVIKKEYSLEIMIGLKALISKINYKNILTMVKQAKNLGVDYIQFKSLRNNIEEIEKDELDYANNLLKESKNLSTDKFKIYGFLQKTKIKGSCFTSPLHTVINSNGDVHVCVFFNHIKTSPIGNVYKTSFEKMWGGKKHKEIIKNIDPFLCNIYDCPFHIYNNYAEDVILNDKMHLEFI